MRMLSPVALAIAFTAAARLDAQGIATFVTTPRLSIGDTAGEPAYMFSRLTDARRLLDGRFVVAACGDRQLRSFDAQGKHLATLSLAESQAPQRIMVRIFPAGGDTIGVHEILNTRLTLVNRDLQTVRTIPVPNPVPPRPDGRPSMNTTDVIGRFADGTFLGRRVAPPSNEPGITRRMVSFYRFDNAGVIRDSLTGTPGVELMVGPGGRSGGVRLARSASAAMFADRLLIGDQAVAELAEYGPDLKPLRRVPTATKPVPVTDSIKALWVTAANSRALFPVNGVTPVFLEAYPDMMPAFRDIVTGSDGRAWVQDPIGANSYPLLWTAYQGARPVARVELPARFYPTQFGNDWVLGIQFDTTATERVQLRQFTPGPLSNKMLTPKEAAPTNRPQCGAWISR
jgi:hypothetical protein